MCAPGGIDIINDMDLNKGKTKRVQLVNMMVADFIQNCDKKCSPEDK